MPTKAVRFSDKEYKNIEKFLKNNTFFDFSTLARIAILKFITNPELKIESIKEKE